ncbi:TetR-like C-terminal domain-containing protein [Terrisporobacter petrolearius]|uniref:TetR/AcrR family transcriptional regulator n=1 Tax=Terrisporobacter petrolearius TaxID=1460447 RepID=UPI0031CC6DD6
MNIKNDRRIRKSKESLKQSLINLMKEKPINNITVKELVLAADLNRSTFYNYYCDIPDMLEKLETELYNEFIRILELHVIKDHKTHDLYKEAHEFIEDMCDVINESADFCQCIFSQNGDISFLFKLEELVEDHIKDQLRQDFDGKMDYPAYVYSFVKSGYIGILKSWMKGGCVESPQDIANLTYNLVEGVLYSCKL